VCYERKLYNGWERFPPFIALDIILNNIRVRANTMGGYKISIGRNGPYDGCVETIAIGEIYSVSQYLYRIEGRIVEPSTIIVAEIVTLCLLAHRIMAILMLCLPERKRD
jgi:hypothetical protein